MLVTALIAEFRRVMSDEAAPYFWQDDEIVRYIAEAVDEACERALLIEDRSTAEVCQIAIEAGTDEYQMHSSVIAVKRAKVGDNLLSETSVEAMDDSGDEWETREGEPMRFIQSESSIRLTPIPTEAATLAMTVFRRPVDPIDEDTDLNDVMPERYHLRLMPWVYRCAYRKTDSETFNEKFAESREIEFTRMFGVRLDANVQRKHRDKRMPVVRINW